MEEFFGDEWLLLVILG